LLGLQQGQGAATDCTQPANTDIEVLFSCCLCFLFQDRTSLPGVKMALIVLKKTACKQPQQNALRDCM
jgi:hypothetical protein